MKLFKSVFLGAILTVIVPDDEANNISTSYYELPDMKSCLSTASDIKKQGFPYNENRLHYLRVRIFCIDGKVILKKEDD